MYVQPITIEKKIERTDERIKDASVLSKTLKTISTGLEKVPPYKTVNNSEPPVRLPPATTLPKIETQRNRGVLHTLVRTNVDGLRPSVTSQATAMFNGFQSCITPLMQKSKPYYHLTYPVPPSKYVCYVKQRIGRLLFWWVTFLRYSFSRN